MIHHLSCNSRDCPWYRRGEKCKHPAASSPNVASIKQCGVPDTCPVVSDSQILIAVAEPRRTIVDAVKDVREQINTWCRLSKTLRKIYEG